MNPCAVARQPILKLYLKGLRPLPPTPADSRIFGFFYFSENVDLGNFPVGFGVWEGVESIGNGSGIQMDGFSAREVPYSFIFDYFHDFGNFGVVFDGLMLLLVDPWTS